METGTAKTICGKSSIFFSPNTDVLIRSEICQTLHIDTEAISDKYLGLPAIVGADRSDCFLYFVERIIQHISTNNIARGMIRGSQVRF
jgi:hypothetical protein